MKVAVLSDIHGNLPALEVVAAHVEAWAPDAVVVNGDVVNRGPRSRRCWEFVQARRADAGWQLVSGNHERYVARWQDSTITRRGRAFQIHRSSFWTFRRLGRWARALAALPEQVALFGPGGGAIRITHGSMRGDRDGIYPETAADKLACQIAPPPAVFCTAHTHRPLVRRFGGTLVVNSGAVGATFDGDVRASYAQLTWQQGTWQAQIVRLTYDREQMDRDFRECAFIDGGGPLVRIFFAEWYHARPLVHTWAQQYEAAVLAGEIELAASVDQFLAGVNGSAG